MSTERYESTNKHKRVRLRLKAVALCQSTDLTIDLRYITTVIDEMNPVLYNAVVKGNVEDYREALGQMPGEARRRQVTTNGNTVLHVAAIHGHKDLVEEILNEVKDDDAAAMSLLFAKNNRNESVLHCAADKGYDSVVSVIFSAIKKHEDEESAGGRVREMIEMRDDVKDTALHKAVRMGHLEVVKLLVKEDPEFEYLANDDGETPIYIAAELQFHGCLKEMLNTCQKPTYGGPLGRNALHAAILTGFGYTKISKSVKILSLEYHIESRPGEFATECTQLLLEKKICLCEEIDKSGWTPLHYAVKIENYKAACMILERKTSAAYICAGDNDEWTTTFHIAARHDKVKMMKEISNRCPDCWEMVNSKGQNVLHETILNKQFRVLNHIEESYDQFDNLVHHKDEDGNTPLHLLAVNNCNDIIHYFIRERPMLNYFAFNKKHQTLFDMAVLERNNKLIAYSHLDKFTGKRTLLNSRKFADRMIENPEHKDDEEAKEIKGMIGTAGTSIVVATLILTMTFAAGIALPGGYNQENGYPIFLRNAAFKAFILTDTIAFLSSFSSIAVHIMMVKEASNKWRSIKTVTMLNNLQHTLLAISCIGVVIAFLCAMYVILAPLRDLTIADLTIGSLIGAIASVYYVIKY